MRLSDQQAAAIIIYTISWKHHLYNFLELRTYFVHQAVQFIKNLKMDNDASSSKTLKTSASAAQSKEKWGNFLSAQHRHFSIPSPSRREGVVQRSTSGILHWRFKWISIAITWEGNCLKHIESGKFVHPKGGHANKDNVQLVFYSGGPEGRLAWMGQRLLEKSRYGIICASQRGPSY